VAPSTGGYSLVLNNPAPNSPTTAAYWRSSAQPDGTPGAPAGPAFTGSPSGDSDGDGLSDYLEYALGSDAASNTSGNRPTGSLQLVTVGGTPATYLTLTYRRNNAADGVNYYVEFSTNLTAWTNETTRVSTTQNTDGTATIVYRSNVSAGEGPQFLRLRVAP
jgi:hypothetical protein